MSFDLLEVAIIGKSISFKGECKLHITSDFPNQFKENALFKDVKNNTYEIEYFHKKKSTVKFKNINSDEDIKKLASLKLYVSKEDTLKNCQLNKDEFFYFDIMDCEIIQDNIILGKVSDISEISGINYFQIETSKDLENMPKIFMLPYDDKYIIEMDVKNKKIYVKDAKIILENS
jgi:16S rRNA processing protein RimM